MGLMLHRVLAVAEELARQGISIEVIDPRTASPLDVPTILQSVAKTGRLLIVDEAYGPCSLAAEIAARVADAGFDDLDAPIRRLMVRLPRRRTARAWKKWSSRKLRTSAGQSSRCWLSERRQQLTPNL